MNRDSGVPLIDRAVLHSERGAIVDRNGKYTYAQLLSASENLAVFLLNGKNHLKETRVAFMIPPSITYVVVQWGIWQAGGISVPLCVTHPVPELEYVINDSDAEILIVHPDFADMLRPVAH